MDSNNGGMSFLDALTVFSVILQLMGYQEGMDQRSNNDIMEELQKHDRRYLEQILENQKIILEKLARLG